MSDEAVHSRFGGSSAPRYMNCPGSVALLATIPARPDSAYAAEGTRAHTLGEYALRNGYDSARAAADETCYAERDGTPIVFSDETCAAVQVYLDAVYAEMAAYADTGGELGELYVEQSFVLDIPGCEPGEVHGKNDAMVYHPATGRLRVFDYKHGVGVSVDADDNAQLKFYAAGAVFSHPDWKISEVVLTIVQPRARDADTAGAVKDWAFDVIELLEFQGELEKAIAAAKAVGPSPDGVFLETALKAGPWCDKTFCDAKAAGKCPAVNAAALEHAGLDFAGVKIAHVADAIPQILPDPAKLDGVQLARVVAGLGYLTTWANKCQEYLEAMLMAGHEVPGWKVVPKLGRAKWIDDPAQVVAYADMMFGIDPAQLMPPKIVTITEAEKLLKAHGAKKADVDDFKLRFTIKDSDGLTIAPASDRREAVNAVAENFGGVNVALLAAE